MADYSQLKVPELKKLLQEKSLPISGNKADLIARLQEADKKPEAEATGMYKIMRFEEIETDIFLATTGDDEIDWDEDDEKKATTTADAAVAAAGGKEEIPNPTKVPNQQPAIDPAKTTDLKVNGGEGAPKAADGVVAAPAPATTEAAAVPEAPKQDFSAGMEKTDAEKEAEKRAARAKRFGIVEDDEAKKLAERAKKFGTNTETVVKGLDSALPEGRQKRSREDKQGGRNPKRQTPDRRSQPAHKPNQKPGVGAGARKPAGRVTDDPTEKAKAEMRAKRFATAA